MVVAAKAFTVVGNHEATVLLFCRCGKMLELFQAEFAKCENPNCPEYNKLYQISVTVTPYFEKGSIS
jgi:hypothetical protein